MTGLVKNKGYLKKGTASYGNQGATHTYAVGSPLPVFNVEFFNDSESITKLSTTQIKLLAGKKYRLTCDIDATLAAENWFIWQFYNVTTGGYVGGAARTATSVSTSWYVGMSRAQLTIVPTVDTTLEVRNTSGIVATIQTGSSVYVEEVEAYLPTLPYDNTPKGTIQMTGRSTAPDGWLLCTGTAISRSTYAQLFSAIGTSFGVGDGSTTFNIPDMRGACPAGVGTSTGYSANETVVLGAKSDDKMQGHRHKSYGYAGSTSDYLGGSTAAYGIGSSGVDALIVFDPKTDGANGTPRTATATKGKTVGINYIIKI